MPEHYTKNTLECTAWCRVCQKHTQHRVDGGRRGPCLEHCAGGPRTRALYDFKFPDSVEMICAHCDQKFSPTAEATLDPPYLVVKCTRCGCITPFPVDVYRTKAQEARRRKEEQERRQPRLFGEQ